MIKILSNRKGFALALILALLPVLLGAFFASSVAIVVIQTDLRFKHICRSEGLRTQEKIGRHLQRLLSLNPRAAQLRLQMQSARIALAAAMAAQNPIATAKLIKQIAQLKRLQASLDIRQRQLILESNRELQLSYRRAQGNLKTAGAKTLNGIPGLTLKFRNGLEQPPQLAVEPDSLELAPIYRLRNQFEQRQALAHRWHYEIALRPPISGYIGTKFEFEKSCAVTLSQKGLQWVAKITKDRSLSKSAW